MSRGRDTFNKYKKYIFFISRIIGLFPRKIRHWFYNHIRNWNGTVGLVFRYATLKTLAKAMGDNISIHPGVYIFYPERLIIGNNVSLHPMCYIDAFGGITLESNISIAHSVTLLSANHNYADTSVPINDQGMESRPLTIDENVWIGAKATILGGIKILSGTVVAAGAVVTKNFDKDIVLAGIPAKEIGRR